MSKFPKVLVVSTNAWRDNTGINTLIEFFRCWDIKKLAQIYAKDALPNTEICNQFFRISESSVVKSFLLRSTKTGKRVQNTPPTEDAGGTAEQQRYATPKNQWVRQILSYAREFAWFLGRWKSDELDTFIKRYQTDVLFLPVYPTIYMGRIQKYVMQKSEKPVVAYLADDNYSYKPAGVNPMALIHRFLLRRYVRYIVKNAAKVLVIAPKQQEEYRKVFGVESEVLTKGIDFPESFTPTVPHQPIRLVYTGKLIIGRWRSLAAIAEAMGEINAHSQQVILDIYTTDSLSAEQQKKLNRNGSQLKGAITLAEVKKVQQEADVVVFVESLDSAYKHAARLSFSTKITDYLRSGKCIFAIGDSDIAPIDYFKRYDSAVTACSYREIGEKLKQLIENPDMISQYARRAYSCGREHHSRDKMNALLIDSIQKAKDCYK